MRKRKLERARIYYTALDYLYRLHPTRYSPPEMKQRLDKAAARIRRWR
jgi:hypothetical protein